MQRIIITVGLGLFIGACSVPDAPTLTAADAPARALTVSSTLTRVDLGTLGGTSSYAADINNGSLVVGWSETAGGATHGFRWSPTEGMLDLPPLTGDPVSQAIAILDGKTPGGGQVLGISGDYGRWTPVVWSASRQPTALVIPLLSYASFGQPTAFSAAGDVVGWDAAPQHAWYWSGTGDKIDLTANTPGGSTEGGAVAVSPSGVVLLTTTNRSDGCLLTTQCWRTYLWSARAGYQSIGTPTSDPEVDVTAAGINASGTVVGRTRPNRGISTAYRWDPGAGFTLLPMLTGGSYSYAAGVSPAGTVVGAALEPTDGAIVATAWPTSGGILRLSPADPNTSVAVAINAPGTIAGWAVNSAGATHATIWTDAPDAVASGLAAASPSRTKVAVASARCLADPDSASSRARLFACVLAADRLR